MGVCDHTTHKVCSLGGGSEGMILQEIFGL